MTGSQQEDVLMYVGHRKVKITLEKNTAVQSLLLFSVHVNLLHVLSAVTSIQKLYIGTLISIHHSYVT